MTTHAIPTVVTTSTSRRWIAWPIMMAVALAVISVLADLGNMPRGLVLVGNLAAPWFLGALLVGWAVARPRAGAIAGGATLILATALYYATSIARGYSWDGALRGLAWMSLAVAVGPFAGWAGAILAQKRHGARRRLAVVIASSGVLAEMLWEIVDRRIWMWNLPQMPGRWVDSLVFASLTLTGIAIAILASRRMPDRATVLRRTALASIAGGLAIGLLHAGLRIF